MGLGECARRFRYGVASIHVSFLLQVSLNYERGFNSDLYSVVASASPDSIVYKSAVPPPLPSESTPLLSQIATTPSPVPEHTGMTLIIKPAASEKSWTRSLIRVYNTSRQSDEE